MRSRRACEGGDCFDDRFEPPFRASHAWWRLLLQHRLGRTVGFGEQVVGEEDEGKEGNCSFLRRSCKVLSSFVQRSR